MAFGIEDIENALGKSLPLIILRNEARNALKSSKIFDKLSEEYIQKAIDCFKLKNVKQAESIAKKEQFCRNGIFFVAEGEYIISDASKKGLLYGQTCLVNYVQTYNFELRMKENGKIAYTTFTELVSSFGCTLSEALHNSASISKALQTQKVNRNHLNEMSKNIKLDGF